MTKKKVTVLELDDFSTEEVEAKLTERRQERMDEFKTKLETMCAEYGVLLTARFQIFNVVVDPPIQIIPAPQRE